MDFRRGIQTRNNQCHIPRLGISHTDTDSLDATIMSHTPTPNPLARFFFFFFTIDIFTPPFLASAISIPISKISPFHLSPPHTSPFPVPNHRNNPTPPIHTHLPRHCGKILLRQMTLLRLVIYSVSPVITSNRSNLYRTVQVFSGSNETVRRHILGLSDLA